ncbi:hypothetical protein [Gardnerella sp. DNF00983]|uniref:hypothetical protein n=1 Tax=Gardnerella sp. DNF00983 TaxID=2749056 RepID=UPI003BAB64A1
MSKTFGFEEHKVLSLFSIDNTFSYKDKQFKIINSGKPTCKKGEPKTDIYVRAIDANSNIKEFKISFKKENAEFLENKTNAIRAEQLFGYKWKEIISASTAKLKSSFESKPLIYKSKLGRIEDGAITLGWKFELLNVKSGKLSEKIDLTRQQVIDVYAGTNLSEDKRNAYVNNTIVKDSGVANFLLFEKDNVDTVQDAVNSLVTIEEYVNNHPEVYFACKALNYRSIKDEYDGNRPLAVYVNWFVNNGKLDYKLVFDRPLLEKGDAVYERLKSALDLLGISNTNDLSLELIMHTESVNI